MPRKVGGKGAALEVERNNTTKSKAKHNNGCATHIILFNSCNSTTEVLNSHFIYEVERNLVYREIKRLAQANK